MGNVTVDNFVFFTGILGIVWFLIKLDGKLSIFTRKIINKIFFSSETIYILTCPFCCGFWLGCIFSIILNFFKLRYSLFFFDGFSAAFLSLVCNKLFSYLDIILFK